MKRSPALAAGVVVILCAAIWCAGCGARHTIKATSPHSEVVEADGTSPVVNNDIAGARKASLDDALKNALGLVIGVYVSQEALVSKAVLIEDNISSQTEGYIEKYDTLKEWRDGDFYMTRIRALVRKEDLSAKLKALEIEPKRLGNPVVKFAVEEYVDGTLTGDRSAETELKKAFLDKGFIVSDSGPSDIMIEGRADSNFNGDSGMAGLVSYRATLTLKAVKAGSNDVMATVNETLGGIDAAREAAARTAVGNTARKAGRTLPADILTYLRERSTVQLTISNVSGINNLNAFTKTVRSLIEVRDCWVRSYENGVALMDMDLKKGTASDVARRIETMSVSGVKIKEVSAYGIKAEFERK